MLLISLFQGSGNLAKEHWLTAYLILTQICAANGQPGVLSILFCPARQYTSYAFLIGLSCLPCVSRHAVHCTGFSNHEHSVPLSVLHGQPTTDLVILPMLMFRVRQSGSWGRQRNHARDDVRPATCVCQPVWDLVVCHLYQPPHTLEIIASLLGQFCR